MGSGVVVLSEYASEIEANLLIQRLSESGIQAWVDGGNANAAMGFAGSGAPLLLRIFVAKDDESEAKLVLSDVAPSAPSEEDSWEKHVRARTRTGFAVFLLGGYIVPIIIGGIASLTSGWIVFPSMILGVLAPPVAVIAAVWSVHRRRGKRQGEGIPGPQSPGSA